MLNGMLQFSHVSIDLTSFLYQLRCGYKKKNQNLELFMYSNTADVALQCGLIQSGPHLYKRLFSILVS